MGLEASRARALNDSLLILRAAGSRVLTTKDGWPHRKRPVGSAGGASGFAERRGPGLLRPGWGPWGRITRHRERSGPHRSPAIALEHGHSVTKRDISLWKHVCVTRSLLKAIMADAQPFNTRSAAAVQFRGPTCAARESLPLWRGPRTPIGSHAPAVSAVCRVYTVLSYSLHAELYSNVAAQLIIWRYTRQKKVRTRTSTYCLIKFVFSYVFIFALQIQSRADSSVEHLILKQEFTIVAYSFVQKNK